MSELKVGKIEYSPDYKSELPKGKRGRTVLPRNHFCFGVFICLSNHLHKSKKEAEDCNKEKGLTLTSGE